MRLCLGDNCTVVFFPEQPTGIEIIGDTQDVKFSWGQSTGTVDGYRLYWGSNKDGPYSNQLCDVNSTTLEYSAELDSLTRYYLVCRAYNEHGESGNSNEVPWPK